MQMEGSLRIEREAAAWIARRDAGMNTAERAALEAWISTDAMHRVAWLRLDAAWDEAGRLQALAAGLPSDRVPAHGAWPWLSAEVSPPQATPATAQPPPTPEAPPASDLGLLVLAPRAKATRKRWPVLAMAAALAVLAVGLVWHLRPLSAPATTYASAVGQLRSVTLADGSQATLGGDSQIAVRMSGGQRNVTLQRGEAYFQVRKDAARPFSVQAGGYRAVALGTRFAVKHQGKGAQVVVTEGLVRLDPATGATAPRTSNTLLPAGAIARADASGVTVQTGSVAQAYQALSWRDGFLAFHDTPLRVAVAEFNRYSHTRIVIADQQTAALRIGGSFRWSNAEAFVRLLEAGFPVRVERRAGVIVVSNR